MKGDVGPYLNDYGDVWVPRTVPYLEARREAKVTVEWDQRLVYIGKSNAELLGFTRDCDCEERCYGGPENDDGDHDPDPACRVPAWHFRVVEP